jgi:DNA-binding NarL/FixJ family response regulator
MKQSINILIADDHKIVRDGIKRYLNNDNNFNLLYEASNGREAYDFLKDNQVDVILSDLNMPEMDGLELTEKVVKEYPDTKVIILTMMDEPHYIKKLMGSGAEGYLFKNSGVDEVKQAIRKVAAGETYMSQEVTESLTNYVIKRKQSNPKYNKFGFNVELSERELEVLELIIKEYTNQEIADKLYISVRTVDAHKRHMIEKTGSRNLAGLIMYAIAHELFANT